MNILVTGGSKGLGSSIVRLLSADASNQVYFTYCHSESLAAEITDKYDNAHKIYCDFSDEASLTSLIAAMSTMELDILINNAAVNFTKNHFQKLAVTNFLDSFKVNVISTIVVTQAALLIFRRKKSGKIITILSSAIVGTPPVGWSEYVANKNYLLSLAKSWATENIRFNISSNCVSPSFMQTDFNQEVDSRVVEGIIENHPLKKLLTIAEVADTVAFLCKSSLHINGVNIVMNAGTDN